MDNVSNIDALRKWNDIPEDIRNKITNTVFCGECGTTSIKKGFTVTQVEDLGLLLHGSCSKCGHKVCRVIEN